MPVYTAENLAAWTGGAWTHVPDVPVTSVSHDTRDLQPGALYVALPGERVDGHDLIGKAHEAGAVSVLCMEGKSNPLLPCLEVPDTGKALENLAKGYRLTLQPRQMIGITGSAGKTTVKDFLSAMLSAAGKTRSTRGNWNNFVGLPLSLLSMEPEDAFGVFELGMNRAGEISALADILKPDAALITSIGEAHLEQLGSVEAIAEEKTSLLLSLSPGDLSVLDADSSWYAYVKSRCNSRAVEVSMNGQTDYTGEVIKGGLRITDHQRNEVFELARPLPGAHMVTNLLQAVAMARECGLKVEQIRSGLEKYTPAPMRWQTVPLKKFTVINDAYNANPLSMRKSLRTFSELFSTGEKWLVLGGMAELGETEKELHRVIGKEADTYGFNGILLVGEKASWMRGAIKNTPVFSAATLQEAFREITDCIPPDAVLLLKGSRSERLEWIVQELQKQEEGAV